MFSYEVLFEVQGDPIFGWYRSPTTCSVVTACRSVTEDCLSASVPPKTDKKGWRERVYVCVWGGVSLNIKELPLTTSKDVYLGGGSTPAPFGGNTEVQCVEHFGKLPQ